jgi:hypothetical protein
VREVRGPGVLGEQPRLEPGDEFEYTSGVPLTTPSGIMTGSYQMETQHGESFDVEIPHFSLDSPHQPVKVTTIDATMALSAETKSRTCNRTCSPRWPQLT